MKNKITFFLILFLFLGITDIFAQKRTILYQDDTIKIVHDFYEGIPNRTQYHLYPSTSLYYVVEKNKIDTFGLSYAFPRGKTYYDGRFFTLMLDQINAEASITFLLMEKIDGRWRHVVAYGGCRMNSKSIYSLEQTSMFTLKEIISGYYPTELIHEIKIDIQNRTYNFPLILNGKGDVKMRTVPFRNQWKF
jgi:hypothetical protein